MERLEGEDAIEAMEEVITLITIIIIIVIIIIILVIIVIIIIIIIAVAIFIIVIIWIWTVEPENQMVLHPRLNLTPAGEIAPAAKVGVDAVDALA